MRFRSIRERKLLSQERLAEMSGLSLRTIQRVEAGHRISFASLRSLAVTLQMDVDQLERELYAMKNSTDDFVEVPRWVRVFTGGYWEGLPRMSRRHTLVLEAASMGVGVLFLVVSFLVTREGSVTSLRFLAAASLICGYLMSVGVRVIDTYKAWPVPEAAPPDEKAARTRRSTLAFYAFQVFLVLFILVSVLLQEAFA